MVGYDSIIPPAREGKITQEIKIGSGYHGLIKKYVTVTSNAKNQPELRLSLSFTIQTELEVSPAYLSLKPDKKGMIKQTLTITTQKKDLQVLEFSFKEQGKPDNNGVGNWQVSLPLRFTTELTKVDTVLSDGYLKYQLDVSLSLENNQITYGTFTLKTNHPKKEEITLNGVILEQEK